MRRKSVCCLALSLLVLLFAMPLYAEPVSNNLDDIICDRIYYADKYSDLKLAFGYDHDKLLNHWRTYGIAEGRSPSSIYDAQYYINKYGDLKQAFTRNGRVDWSALYNHFKQYGINEGRQASPHFNVSVYKSNYADLRQAFGGTNWKYLKHWREYGMAEHRNATSSISPGPVPPNPPKPTGGLRFPIRGAIVRSSSVKTNSQFCDYRASEGTPIYAPASGKVEFRQSYSPKQGKLSSYGNSIRFTSSDGKYSVICAHLSRFEGVQPKYTSSLSYPCGQKDYPDSRTISLGSPRNVNQGDLLGYTGHTGNASGPHVHIEVRQNNTPKDPAEVFKTW